MSDVWLLHEYAGEMELFRADAIEHLKSNGQQVVARRVGGDNYTAILHISGRKELPDDFAVDLLRTIAAARKDHPDEDTVIVIRYEFGRGWKCEIQVLAEYKKPS
ncbi:hypothetical protein AB0N09_35955 [Streptomyces erythrochromogenes]|uniref:hypothetical protein n=1 Tax=Streptomyces erythrochromogenes TaxID=285574 RepID=UPI00343EB9CB